MGSIAVAEPWPAVDVRVRCERAGSEFGVIVADDHLSYVEALAMALRLRRPGDHVWGAQRVEELWASVGDADVVVLDWLFGDVDGVQVADRLSHRDDPPHVVLVSGHHSPALERLAAGAGVCAVLPKHASIETIGAAIDRCRDDPAHARTRDGGDSTGVLSRRQVEVLWLLSAGRDTAQVAAELYLSVSTVRSYVRDACRRLDAHSQLEAVAKARRAGLIPSESTPPMSGS